MNATKLLRLIGRKPYTHLFFDLDRTLWDFEGNAKQTLSDLYQEFELFNHFKTFEEFRSIFEVHNDRLWEEYRHGRIAKDMLRKLRFDLTLKSVKVKNEHLANLLDTRYISDSPQKTRLMPNAVELLEYLKQRGYRMLIITNGFNEVQWIKLKVCGLEQYFDKMLTSENVGHQKPDPRIFNHALKEAGCRASRALMIGDDFAVDIAGAKDAGIDQVYYNPNGLKATISPTYEVADLIELKRIL